MNIPINHHIHSSIDHRGGTFTVLDHASASLTRSRETRASLTRKHTGRWLQCR
jgi:hypothetical protein